MHSTTRKIKMRVMTDGTLEVIDPAMEDLPLLQAIDPDYRIITAPLKGFVAPRFQSLRMWYTPLLKENICEVSLDILRKVHEQEMYDIKKCNYNSSKILSGKNATLMDVKIELARRELMDCKLCVRRCGADRLNGGKGFCGLGADAYVADTFIHIAEEPPINPSLLIELHGCALRCRFCQKPELHNISTHKILNKNLWGGLSFDKARSLSFIGGNPDESIYAILRFLNTAPDRFCLPVVWNCHGYADKAVYQILEGVVDTYIPDLKYGNDECAAKWSSVRNYVETAHNGINEMIVQGVPVFVRILILPGHGRCCHVHVIRWLEKHKDKMTLNLMEQYFPENGMEKVLGAMADRPKAWEIKMLRKEARKAGLSLINKGGRQ